MIIINMIKEFGNRLFRTHNLNEVQSTKLRRIKYPGLIMPISNESEHQIKERIIKINKSVEEIKKKQRYKQNNGKKY